MSTPLAIRDDIAAAVREARAAALDEAAALARSLSACLCGAEEDAARPDGTRYHLRTDTLCPRCDLSEGNPTPHAVAAAIEALR